MKPESIKYLVDCYLREKKCSFEYDVTDGVQRRRMPGERGSLAAESFHAYDDRCRDLMYMHAEFLAPVLQEAAAENDWMHIPPDFAPVLLDAVPLEPQQQEIARGIARQLSELSDHFEDEMLRGNENRLTADENNIIQFNERCLFVSPSAGFVKIPVTRTGNADEPRKLKWKTQDITAKSGVHYVGGEDEISFAKGDMQKFIKIEILNTQQEETNLRFLVDLFDPEDVVIGILNPLTVNISNHENLYPDERQVIENIIRTGPRASIFAVVDCLNTRVTANTFRTALQFVCSLSNSVKGQLGLALELTRQSMERARLPVLTNILAEYFETFPDLDELEEFFHGNC